MVNWFGAKIGKRDKIAQNIDFKARVTIYSISNVFLPVTAKPCLLVSANLRFVAPAKAHVR